MNNLEIGTKVKVISVKKSTESLRDWVMSNYPYEDLNTIFDYNTTLGCTGEIAAINKVSGITFVILDGWNGRDICFFTDELEII